MAAARSMQAALWTAYGPPEVLQVREIPVPSPADKQILVKVAVSNVFPGDCELRRLDVKLIGKFILRLALGWSRPRAGSILGQEFAGTVVAVGRSVTRFKPGERVFGASEPFVHGTYCEYLVASGAAVTQLPDNVPFQAAAVLTIGGLNALDVLRTAGLDNPPRGRRVLLNGACGSIGTLAVQLARRYGHEVTAVDAPHKLAKLRELGADHVIDYTRDDFTRSGAQYDVVIDLAGKCDFLNALRSVKPGGWLLLPNPPRRHVLLRFLCNPFSMRKIRFPVARYRLADLDHLKQLVSDGTLLAVIDRSFSLAQVADAHRYIDANHRIGNVTLTISG